MYRVGSYNDMLSQKERLCVTVATEMMLQNYYYDVNKGAT